MLTTIIKRDGRKVPFDETKITDAIFAAAQAVGGADRSIAMRLTLKVMDILEEKYGDKPFTVEDVQDIVEKS